MSKKILCLSGLIGGLLTIALGVRLLLAYTHNDCIVYGENETAAEFVSNGQENLYTKGLWPHTAEDALEELQKTYFPFSIGGGDVQGLQSNVVELDSVLRYYHREYGRFVQVRELPVGTKVVVNGSADSTDTGLMIEAGKSIYSFPTCVRGWRYVRMFDVVESNDSVTPGSDMVYIRLSDLERVFDLVYTENEAVFRQYPSMAEKTDSQIKNMMLLYADRFFYANGVFRSPDFYHPYFDTTNIVLLSAAGVLLTLHIVLRVRKAKRKKENL